MKKYFRLFQLTLQEYFVYRLNFVLWRFRSLVFFLTFVFFWLAVYGGQNELLGYQKAQMLTYAVGAAFLRGLVMSTRTADLAGQIRSGELTRVVVWPFKMVIFWFTRDMVDKILNIFFAVLEIGLVLFLLDIPFYFPKEMIQVVFFSLFVFLSFLLYFFISYFISVTAFWTEELWATRWLFGVIILNFFAGALFPVDILPLTLRKIAYLTPFPYLLFFPLKVWLGQLTTPETYQAILICSVWLVFFYWFSTYLWKKGVKNYGAYGG